MNLKARDYLIEYLKTKDIYYLYTCIYIQYEIPEKLPLTLNEFCNCFHQYKDMIMRYNNTVVRCVDISLLIHNLKGFFSIVEIDTFDMTTNQYIKIYA